MSNLSDQAEKPGKNRIKRLFDSNSLFFIVPFLVVMAILFLVGYLLLGVGVTAAVLVGAGSITQPTNWLFIIPAILVLNGISHNLTTKKWDNYLLVYSLAVRNTQGRWVDDYDGSINESLLDRYSSAVVQSFSPLKGLIEITVWNKDRNWVSKSWSGKSTAISSPEALNTPREWKKIYKYNKGRNNDYPSNFINGVFFREAGPYQVSALEARRVSACKANRSYTWAKYSAILVAVTSILSFLVNGF